jgi:ABC-type multidrug transport system ATPase subunit
MAYGDVVVLDDVDLTVAVGEIVALTGVNGVGKSTLLTCIVGFRSPAAGTVSVLGGPPRDNAAFWRSVAIVADQPTWYPGLTVRELLELVRVTHRPLRGWCLPADELIELFGLTARADASPLSLSSGQRSACRSRRRSPGRASCSCSMNRSSPLTRASGRNWPRCSASSTPRTAARS